MAELPFLPFHRPTVYDHHILAMADTLRSGWLTSAGKVEEFEKAFAKKVGGLHAVAVNSCTAAIHLAMVCAGVKPKDEVITSPITFVSAVNVIEHIGARPVFADVLPDNLTIDPASVRRKITKKTKLIVATHFAGFPACMDEISAVSGGIPIVSDSAHAIETVYHGRRSGGLGIASCYSFYATKNITTGEGGMLVTDDEELANRARVLRLHGMSKDAWARYSPGGYRHWDVERPGWKYNMSDVQAALGLSQLSDIDAWLGKRTLLWGAYLDHLDRKNVGVLTGIDEDTRPARHLFVVRVPGRDFVMDAMQKAGIGVGVHFRAVHRLKYYQKKYAIPKTALPEADRASDEVLSLPLYPLMETTDIYRVISTLEGLVGNIKHKVC